MRLKGQEVVTKSWQEGNPHCVVIEGLAKLSPDVFGKIQNGPNKLVDFSKHISRQNVKSAK